MADTRVLCVTKTDRVHERLTHLGGDGWKWPIHNVINSIEQKTNTFYTLVDGKRADIGVVQGQSGKYVRTYADGVWNDNLLALPTCAE